MPSQETKIVPSYICNKCDILLRDGIMYSWCPKCGHEAEKVDPIKDIYACPRCDYMINRTLSKEETKRIRCKKCKGEKLKKVPGSGKEFETWKVKSPHLYFFDRIKFDFLSFILPSASILLIGLAIIFFIEKASIGSNLRQTLTIGFIFFMVPLMLIMILGFLVAAVEILSALGFLVPLFWKERKRVKINHGLEHGTINILLEHRLPVFSGQSDEKGFRINAALSSVSIGMAFAEAVRRIKSGEGNLALSPRCGTTIGTIGLIYAACIIALTMTWYLKYLSLVNAYTIMIVLFFVFFFFKYSLSLFLQKALTVSSKFSNANIVEIEDINTTKHEFVHTHYVATEVIP